MNRAFIKIEETNIIERKIDIKTIMSIALGLPNAVESLKERFQTKSSEEADAIAECLYNGANTGFIDGKALSEKLFHLCNRKVFISHSHQGNFVHACMLAKLLGIGNCFIDGILWKDVYRALDAIIAGKAHSRGSVRRLYSSMFLMLGTAIAEAMQQAETIIYIQPSLVSPDDSGWEPMLDSPWIYWEQKIGKILYDENQTGGMEKQAVQLDENFSSIPHILFPDCSAFCRTLNDAALKRLIYKYNSPKEKS